VGQIQGQEDSMYSFWMCHHHHHQTGMAGWHGLSLFSTRYIYMSVC